MTTQEKGKATARKTTPHPIKSVCPRPKTRKDVRKDQQESPPNTTHTVNLRSGKPEGKEQTQSNPRENQRGQTEDEMKRRGPKAGDQAPW